MFASRRNNRSADTIIGIVQTWTKGKIRLLIQMFCKMIYPDDSFSHVLFVPASITGGQELGFYLPMGFSMTDFKEAPSISGITFSG